MYKIVFKKQAYNFLKKTDQQTKERIKIAIDKLRKNPYSIPYKKLVNISNTYRIRIGDYRIIYSIYQEKLIIEIIKIGKRENIYSE